MPDTPEPGATDSPDPDPQDLGIGLTDLIDLVHTAAGDEDELGRLTTAVVLADRLGELGDHLIGHFVDQARHSGATWTSIGASMGVTKQAAQKRFVPGSGMGPPGRLFGRFTPRARGAVDTARREAERAGVAEIGPEHLVLGLLAERDGLAARALEEQGVTAAKARKKIVALTPKSEAGRPPERLKFSGPLKATLKSSVREALRLGHNYIGTEHLLLGVFADADSPSARALTQLGATRDKTVAWLETELAALAAHRNA